LDGKNEIADVTVVASMPEVAEVVAEEGIDTEMPITDLDIPTTDVETPEA
jgi:hypothetical protein